MPRRCPIAVTVEQSSDDAAVEHSLESLVLFAWLPLSDNLITLREAADVQALWICWPTTKAGVPGSVCFLEAKHQIYPQITQITQIFKSLYEENVFPVISNQNLRNLRNQWIIAAVVVAAHFAT
jgi:hypothetical protein